MKLQLQTSIKVDFCSWPKVVFPCHYKALVDRSKAGFPVQFQEQFQFCCIYATNAILHPSFSSVDRLRGPSILSNALASYSGFLVVAALWPIVWGSRKRVKYPTWEAWQPASSYLTLLTHIRWWPSRTINMKKAENTAVLKLWNMLTIDSIERFAWKSVILNRV